VVSATKESIHQAPTRLYLVYLQVGNGVDMSKVAIVGGAGYVGGWMTDEAIRQGHSVRVIDNLTYEDSYLKSVEFHFGDVLDFSTLESHLAWADTVIWLSALVGDPACAINPKLTRRTNVDSIKKLTETFGGRIIFPSTCSVYGAQDGVLDENSPVGPLSLYAESKLEAENILNSASNECLIFRLGTLFGISDNFARLRVDLVLNVLTIRAILEGSMSVFGGAQYRPLLHVRDVATAAVPHISSSETGVFNLHTENVTVLELAEKIQSIVPNVYIEQTEISFQDARNYRVSSDKARQQLGFAPKWSIEDGIQEVAQVITSKRIKSVQNPRFNNSESLRLQLGVLNK
jgi:nucleoside-diphosphate-sugar epimerase